MPSPALQSNFLVPNATFIAELLAFLIILGVLAKWVIPPINRAMTQRQERIHKQFTDMEQAEADAREAEQQYRAQMADARHEAARIREQAREEASAIKAEMRSEAQAEADRIVSHARNQVELERQQVLQQLRTGVGSMATTLAGRIVGESLEDDERRARTVERFIASMEEQQSATPTGVR